MSCRLVPTLLKTWDTDVANNLSPGEDGMYTRKELSVPGRTRSQVSLLAGPEWIHGSKPGA